MQTGAASEWRAYVCLAQAFLATEVEFDAAERAVADSLRLAPGQPDVHFVAGQVSFARGKWKAARAHYERALALDPVHSGALNELGRIRARRADNVGAARHFVWAAQAAPDVSAYGRNVEVAIQRVMALTVIAAYTACLALVYLVVEPHAWPGTVVIAYTAAAAFSGSYGAVQLWRMPHEMRPLLRTRRVALALGSVYGAILITMIIVAVTPAHAVSGALLAAMALIFASWLAARAILRRKKDSSVGRNMTHDQAA